MIDLTAIAGLARLKGWRGAVATVAVIAVVGFLLYRQLRPLAPDAAAPPKDSAEAAPDSLAPAKGTASLGVERVQLTPVDFSLPSGFFLEVRNSGFGPGSAELLVDFGSALIDSIEFRPAEAFAIVRGGRGSSAIKGTIRGLSANESLYIYALLSAPHLRDITLNPINGGVQEHFTEADLDHQGDLLRVPGPFITFLWFFVAGLMVIGAITFWVWLIERLSSNADDSEQTGDPPQPAS